MESSVQKTRKVLEYLLHKFYVGADGYPHARLNTRDKGMIKAALSAPPRNCDQYNTPEESIRMFESYIRESGKIGFINPFTEIVKWLFAPVEERKGKL